MSLNDLKIFYQNVRSFKRRLDAFHSSYNNVSEFDVIELTETRLNENIKNFDFLDFNISRCDRSSENSQKKHGHKREF